MHGSTVQCTYIFPEHCIYSSLYHILSISDTSQSSSPEPEEVIPTSIHVPNQELPISVVKHVTVETTSISDAGSSDIMCTGRCYMSYMYII